MSTSTARTSFTEAIEDHIALKRQNAALESSMPISRFDIGDPLERFPGGPVRPADGSAPDPVTIVTGALVTDAVGIANDSDVASTAVAPAVEAHVGPTPQQAMRAAEDFDTEHGRTFEPLSGMVPMLSLVEDIDDEDASMGMLAIPAADIMRFPGGAGPRDGGTALAPPAGATEVLEEAPTGEQPVIMVDVDEPLAPGLADDEPRSPERSRRPKFFDLVRRRRGRDEGGSGGEASSDWFNGDSRDFTWD